MGSVLVVEGLISDILGNFLTLSIFIFLDILFSIGFILVIKLSMSISSFLSFKRLSVSFFSLLITKLYI